MTTAVASTPARRLGEEAGLRLRLTVEAAAEGFHRHRFLHAIALLTYTIGIVENLALGLPVSLGLVSIVSGTTFVFLLLIIFLWLAGELARLWWTGYDGPALPALKAKLLDDILAPTRVANTLHAFIANGVFFVGFLAIKKAIPVLNPFAFDQAFMELDRALHFGALPHEILAPLFQYPLVTSVVNVVYNLWFAVLLACLFWQGFARHDSALRQQYLVSYFVCWFVGTCVLGTILSSAGPCFYGFVVQGDNPYTELMVYLKAANEIYPVWAVPTRETLWQSHVAGHGEIEGVSAMPSMHVATAVLFVFLAFAASKRRLGWLLAVFAAAIFLGSVLLGWHYAVDGYLGALIAWASWKFAGYLVERRSNFASVPA